MARVLKYKCNQCGSRVVVTQNMETHLHPIYCCGMEISKVSSQAKSARPKKKIVKKKIAKKKGKK